MIFSGPPNPLDERLDHRNGNGPPTSNGQNPQNGGGNANGGGNPATPNAGGVGLENLGLPQHMNGPTAAALYARSNGSASSSSPPTVSTPSMLIVPQPINAAARIPTSPPGVHNQINGGRKYQCKMCPEVRYII